MRLNFIKEFLYSPLDGGGELISVNEAKEFIHGNVSLLPAVKLPITEAGGFVLAENIFSITDIPAFNQSSVDGYAFAFTDKSERLIINGEAAAGTKENLSLLPKHAVRIFTGAAIPAMADTVVMQERTIIENGELIINDHQLLQGGNFRPKGSEIKAGLLALAKDSFLSPAAIGFLAGIGITNVNVYAKPVISIIVTGNELQQPGQPLQFGQVYESNSFTLKAALRNLHINDVTISWINDDLSNLSEKLNEVLKSSDIVLLTGGISVGDYDFVLRAATACGVEKLFHKVRQRPGKPLYFGKKTCLNGTSGRQNKFVFGLPGNPSSVLTCFYEYVIPAIELMMNRKNIIKVLHAPLARGYKKLPELTFFLKGFYDGNSASPLDAQESYRMSTYAKANCLIRLEEKIPEYKETEIVEIHLLPN
jgi:molybdopterin molybdotransferase